MSIDKTREKENRQQSDLSREQIFNTDQGKLQFHGEMYFVMFHTRLELEFAFQAWEKVATF